MRDRLLFLLAYINAERSISTMVLPPLSLKSSQLAFDKMNSDLQNIMLQ